MIKEFTGLYLVFEEVVKNFRVVLDLVDKFEGQISLRMVFAS